MIDFDADIKSTKGEMILYYRKNMIPNISYWTKNFEQIPTKLSINVDGQLPL